MMLKKGILATIVCSGLLVSGISLSSDKTPAEDAKKMSDSNAISAMHAAKPMEATPANVNANTGNNEKCYGIAKPGRGMTDSNGEYLELPSGVCETISGGVIIK